LTRMLYCPARSPTSFSRRLPGGTRRSPSDCAASKSNNFRSALRWRGRANLLPGSRRKRRSVSVSRKPRIMPAIVTGRANNVKRYGSGHLAFIVPPSYLKFALAHPGIRELRALGCYQSPIRTRIFHQVNYTSRLPAADRSVSHALAEARLST